MSASTGEIVDLAHLLRSAGEYEQGLELLQRLESRLRKEGAELPDSALNAMGMCYNGLEQYELAYEHFRKAANLSPDESIFAANAGLMLVNLGCGHVAIPLLKRAITCSPSSGYPHVVLGDALRLVDREEDACKEYEEGKKLLETALRSSPQDRFLLAWMAGVCQRLGQYADFSAYRQRNSELVQNAYWGASADDFVAGLDSGIAGTINAQGPSRAE